MKQSKTKTAINSLTAGTENGYTKTCDNFSFFFLAPNPIKKWKKC